MTGTKKKLPTWAILLIAFFGLGLLGNIIGGLAKKDKAPEQVTTPVVVPKTEAEKLKEQNDKVLAKAQAESQLAKLNEEKKNAIEKFSQPLNPKYYARYYESYGEDGMKRVNDMLPVVAKMVGESKYCDKIQDIGIADISSKDLPVIFAYCYNSEKFLISEVDLKNNYQPLPISQYKK